MKTPMVYTYKGRDIETLTDAECREALREACEEIASLYERQTHDDDMRRYLDRVRKVQTLS